MTRRALVVVFGSVFGFLGCGSGSSGVSLDQLPSQYAQTVCTQNFKCCTAPDLMSHTMSDCVNTNQSAWGFVTGSIADGQQRGRVAYDGKVMAMCLDAMKNMSCDQWSTGLNQPATCAAAFTPKVATGGPCQNDFECIGGKCDGADSSKTPPVDGKCVATVALGAACSVDIPCADGTYCDSGSMTCKAKKAAGESCSSDDECGNSCNTDTHKCSCYAGCSVAGPISPRSTLLSLVLLGLAFAGAGASRRRRSQR